MYSFLVGPTFFVIAVSLIFGGVALLTFLLRQGWIITGCGFLAMGVAVPGWLTAVGLAGAVMSVTTFWIWKKHGLGRTL